MKKLEFIEHERNQSYKVFFKGEQVLIIERQEQWPHKWVAHDTEGRQCFEPDKYRHDLFDQIKYEGEFE